MSFFEILKQFQRDNELRISQILRNLGQTRPVELGYHFYVRILPNLNEILVETARLAPLRGYEDGLSKYDFMPKYGAVNIQGTKFTAFSSGGTSGTITMFHDSGHAGPVSPIHELDNTEISFDLEKEIMLFDRMDQTKQINARNPREDLALKMSFYKSWGQVQFTIGDPLLSEDGVPTEKDGLLSERFRVGNILERINLAAIEHTSLKIANRDDSTSPIIGMNEVAPGFTAVIHNSVDPDHGVWVNEGVSGGLIGLSNRFVSMYFTVVPIVIGE
jgi:hypothetical protein